MVHRSHLFHLTLVNSGLLVFKRYLIMVQIFICLVVSDIEHLFIWFLARHLGFKLLYSAKIVAVFSQSSSHL